MSLLNDLFKANASGKEEDEMARLQREVRKALTTLADHPELWGQERGKMFILFHRRSEGCLSVVPCEIRGEEHIRYLRLSVSLEDSAYGMSCYPRHAAAEELRRIMKTEDCVEETVRNLLDLERAAKNKD